MIIYFAGIYASSFQRGGNIYLHKLTDEERRQHDQYVVNILESYHYTKRQSQVEKIRRTQQKVFMDSGAYSAYTQGVEVSIESYVQYIKDNQDIIVNDGGALCASVLDAIGDCDATYRNQKTMEALGVTPLPCYHYGEPPEVVEYYAAHYPYITIGGMVPISTPQLRLWLDRLWAKHLTDKYGKPKTKVHGFGLTTVDLMRKYPWYSVDSSAWVQIGSVGNLLWGERGGVLSISAHSPRAKQRDQHYNTMTPLEQQKILEELKNKNFDLQRLQEHYFVRWLYNCRYYEEMRHHVKGDYSFITKTPGLF